MSLSDTLHRQKPLVVTVCVIVLVLAGVFVYRQMAGSPGGPTVAPTQRWFYDVGNGQLFAGPFNDAGPLAAPSGAKLEDGQNGGVLAYVYGCGKCDDAGRFVGYVEILPEREREKPMGMRQHSQAMIAKVNQIGSKEELAWMESATPDGMKIVTAATKDRCPDGKKLIECNPGTR